MNGDRRAWEAGTWEGSRRAQLRRALQLSVRERLEVLETLSETSVELARAAGPGERVDAKSEPPDSTRSDDS